jgi:hypothetical protein
MEYRGKDTRAVVALNVYDQLTCTLAIYPTTRASKLLRLSVNLVIKESALCWQKSIELR